jgi:hypothetical protein
VEIDERFSSSTLQHLLQVQVKEIDHRSLTWLLDGWPINQLKWTPNASINYSVKRQKEALLNLGDNCP